MNLLEQVSKIALDAGEVMLEIYNDPTQDFELDKKDDNSPLTKADLASHHSIVAWLEALELWYPIMSEEWEIPTFEDRKNRETYRCIDPLDGTKEFIKRNGEFTVNIALIQEGRPVLWVVYVPVQHKLYAADADWARLQTDAWDKSVLQVNKKSKGDELKIVWSRSHHAPEVETYVEALQSQWWRTSFIAAWSSLKFCLIAEGKADIYPRYIPTMERDTAAAQCVLEQAWWYIRFVDGSEVTYNRENLRNDFFIAASDTTYVTLLQEE